MPALPGLPAASVFTVKTVPDSERIREWIEREKPEHAVVLGAGFIGLEAAEALHHRGLKVTIVEMLPLVLPPFDPDMAAFVAAHLETQGIQLILADGIKSFDGSSIVHHVILQSGRAVSADLVILCRRPP